MSRGAISHYSSRNLDSCTLQLGNWNPFLSSSAISPSPDSSSKPADHAHLLNEFCPEDDLPDQLALDLDSRFAIRPPGFEARAAGAAALQLGVEPCLVKCSFKHIMGRSLGSEHSRWSSPPLQDVGVRSDGKTWDSSRPVQDLDLARHSGPAAAILGFCERLTEGAGNGGHGAPNSSDCDMVPSSMSILSPRVSGWSKRHKQLSRALARGLWRWKEGSRATKRRRKAGTSRSGSGRSSDRAVHGARMYASDPPTVGASATYATCSDFPMPGTDSSGELFFLGDGNGLNWDPEFSSTAEGATHRRDGGDLYHVWLATETQNLESGYGSEPGYRGDGELGDGDDGVPDEQDEEEKEPLQLSPWRDSVASVVTSSDNPERMAEPEALDEDSVGELGNSNDFKMHHRLRRRRQDWRIFNGQKSRHVWLNGS